jgi:hypothetical protein
VQPRDHGSARRVRCFDPTLARAKICRHYELCLFHQQRQLSHVEPTLGPGTRNTRPVRRSRRGMAGLRGLDQIECLGPRALHRSRCKGLASSEWTTKTRTPGLIAARGRRSQAALAGRGELGLVIVDTRSGGKCGCLIFLDHRGDQPDVGLWVHDPASACSR